MIRVHGTSVALDGEGVLLRGPSGCGKSDLALRLIDQGARLVADDQTELTLEDGDISMTAPATIAGQIEVRGLGLLRVPSVAAAPLRMVVDLVPSAAVERMPERYTAPVRESRGRDISAACGQLRETVLADADAPTAQGKPATHYWHSSG